MTAPSFCFVVLHCYTMTAPLNAGLFCYLLSISRTVCISGDALIMRVPTFSIVSGGIVSDVSKRL